MNAATRKQQRIAIASDRELVLRGSGAGPLKDRESLFVGAEITRLECADQCCRIGKSLKDAMATSMSASGLVVSETARPKGGRPPKAPSKAKAKSSAKPKAGGVKKRVRKKLPVDPLKLAAEDDPDSFFSDQKDDSDVEMPDAFDANSDEGSVSPPEKKAKK